MLYNDWDFVGDEKGVGQSYKDLATSVAIGGTVTHEFVGGGGGGFPEFGHSSDTC